MRAVVCEKAELRVEDREELRPGEGQLLVNVLRCGICGSDLHARHHCDAVAEVTEELGHDGFMRSEQEVVFGHEFCGEIAAHGPGTKRRDSEGTHVVALPLLRAAGKVQGVGLSVHAPGAYAEQLLVQEDLAMAVPNGLAPDISALTEPMAVGLHAVRRGEVGKRDVAIVIGCGPVGLAVIAMLKASGVRRVVAADFSPGRRALAQRLGADLVLDPATDSPYEDRTDAGWLTAAPDALDAAVTGMETLRKLPLPWASVWRAAEKLGPASPNHPVIFECVGVPGIIEQIVSAAPLFSRVVVVGVCMGEDRFRPSMAINKEVDLRFVLGYTPAEFHETLQMLAEGDVQVEPMVTGTVGLDGVDNAFDALGDPEAHAKILIDPRARPEPVDAIVARG